MSAARSFFIFLFVSSVFQQDAFAQSSSSGLPNVPELKEWLAKYGSPSPLIAINKTVSPAFTIRDDHLEAILKGNSKIKFVQPFVESGKNVLEFDVFEGADSRKFETFDFEEVANPKEYATNSLLIDQEQRRFSFILEAFYKLLSNRKSDELLIAIVGATHACDIYLNFFLQDADKIKQNPALQRRREIFYVNYPISENSTFRSKDYYELMLGVDGVETPLKRVSDHPITYATLFQRRLHYYNSLKRDAITVAALKDETLSRLGAIVIMDLHGLDSTEPISRFPSADAIRRAGFKSVKVATEAWIAGKDYSIDDFNRLYRSPWANPLKDYELEFLRKKKPALEKRYLNHELIMDKNFALLHEKLKAYQRGGLPVTLTGLDERDRFTTAIIDTKTEP